MMRALWLVESSAVMRLTRAIQREEQKGFHYFVSILAFRSFNNTMPSHVRGHTTHAKFFAHPAYLRLDGEVVPATVERRHDLPLARVGALGIPHVKIHAGLEECPTPPQVSQVALVFLSPVVQDLDEIFHSLVVSLVAYFCFRLFLRVQYFDMYTCTEKSVLLNSCQELFSRNLAGIFLLNIAFSTFIIL